MPTSAAAPTPTTVHLPKMTRYPLWMRGPIWYDGILCDGYRWPAQPGDREGDLTDVPTWLVRALQTGQIQAFLPPLGSYVTALVPTMHGDVLAYPDDIILRPANGRFIVIEGTSAYLDRYVESQTATLIQGTERTPARRSGRS